MVFTSAGDFVLPSQKYKKIDSSNKIQNKIVFLYHKFSEIKRGKKKYNP